MKIYLKIYILVFGLLLLSNNAYAGISICYDQNSVTNFSLRGSPINGCDYYDVGYNATQEKYDSVKNLLSNVPFRYLKKLNGELVEMTSQEKVDVDEALALQITQDLRSNAKQALLSENPDMKAMRNAFRVVMASLIETRQKLNEVIANGNIPNTSQLPNRTWTQVLNATRNSIDNESDPSL